VLDAWKQVREGSATTPKGTPTFSDLAAPPDTVGTGKNQIILTEEEHGRYAKLVGDARRAIIGAAIQKPAYASGGQGDKERILAEAKAAADAYGRTQFGIELAQQATDDAARTRAANVALSGADNGATMDTLARLAAQGSLTPGVKAALDSQRTYQDPLQPRYELSVDEYLRGSQLVQTYLAAPPYKIALSSQDALQVAHETALLRSAYTAMEREAAGRGLKIWQLDAYKTYLAQRLNTKVGGYPMVRFTNLDGTVNPAVVSTQRGALAQDPLWSRFSAIAKKRDPYAPQVGE